ncbi:MAG: hypothetical protein HKN29_00300, partial [Rhodothermales bacterium]|nr:hypothetical protein [Rhodothermales bacterium]
PQASAYVGSGILFGILGAILLAVALLPARRGPAMLLLKPASDKSFGGGSVRISERSVRHISSRAAELVPGVREAVTRVRMRNDGWQVHCRASITPESSLSDTSTAVRTAISQAIQQQTGLPASRIDVESHQATLQAARQLH